MFSFREFSSRLDLASVLRCLSYALACGGIFQVSTLQAQINDLNDLRQLLGQNGGVTAKATPQAPPVSTNPNVFYTNPGAWGKLRCAYIYLEAPKSLVDSFPLPNTR
ncbi:MAG TPA: hypothetical protein DCP71_16710, partial [Verrucomicrobiales bacterium]|nr:hypothetical protein [Verrucomicrobiales bacterium]